MGIGGTERCVEKNISREEKVLLVQCGTSKRTRRKLMKKNSFERRGFSNLFNRKIVREPGKKTSKKKKQNLP